MNTDILRENARPAANAGEGRNWLATGLLAATMLLLDLDYRPGKLEVMTKTVAADEIAKRESVVPPARDPAIAVAEEYQLARQQGTAEALELFIARHGDDPLAEKARAVLRRLKR
jgi:hypothetical protein